MMNKEKWVDSLTGAEPKAKRASFNSIRAEALADASQKIDRFDSFTTEDKQEYKKILADAIHPMATLKKFLMNKYMLKFYFLNSKKPVLIYKTGVKIVNFC